MWSVRYFNPHFHKGSDLHRLAIGLSCFISIRTSTREVTDALFCLVKISRISIRTSTREVTYPLFVTIWQYDISIRTSTREVTFISVHFVIYVQFQSALPQGKWLSGFCKGFSVSDFNPHFHKGSDTCHHWLYHLPFDFNPHFHKGSDTFKCCLLFLSIDFNPHFHKGSDDMFILNCTTFWISIRTSTREVTFIYLLC